MTAEHDFLLTTKDNKFNPFTQYDQWKHFDEKERHYNTEAYVARVVAELAFQVRNILFGEVSDSELDSLRNQAYNDIIRYNNEIGFDIYTKISRGGQLLDPSPSQYLNAIKN